MERTWTLHIENFDKIKEANLTLTPLMCFVGDNNTGKSHLMSLLWGVLTYGKDVFPTKTSTKLYKACEEWLKTHSQQNVSIDQNTIDIYVAWFNELLQSNKKELVKKIFNYDIAIGKLEIKDCCLKNDIRLQWSDESVRYSATKTMIKFPKKSDFTKDDYLKMNSYICWNILMHGLTSPLSIPVMKSQRNGEPIYFPASRTGFMLTYPQLLSSSIQYSFSISDDETSKLTAPYIDFLQLLTKFEVKQNIKAKELVDFIEQKIVKGSMSVQKKSASVIKFKPNIASKDIPLFATSSVVTEIAPILLTFKSNIDSKVFIIEEPEAHLHPALQQKMARIIIQIINSGIPVWITTHSETILQHVNSMINLNKHPDKSMLMTQYGYTKQDLISPDKISMYQFSHSEDGATNVEGLSSGPYGFVVPTFNDALKAIVDEVYAFQAD